MGGLRVAVSDIVLDEDGEWPEPEPRESDLANVLRGLITAFAASGPVLLLANLAIEKAHDPERHPRDSVEVLVSVILVAGVVGAFAVLGTLMPAFTRFLRDDGRFASRVLRLLIGMFFLVSLL